MKVISSLVVILVGILFLQIGCNPDEETPSNVVKDIDGNVYHSITIGSQTWLAENLSVVHYRNGDPVPNITDGNQWGLLTTGAYCDYNNNTANVTDYGRLYNAYAVQDSRNLAPKGWHIATHAEYQALEEYLGGLTIAGGKMKETGTKHWLTPNKGATNSSGFSALPGGYRGWSNGIFASLGERGGWWTTTDEASSAVYGRFLYFDQESSYVTWGYRHVGMSVRCVKDN